MDDAKNQGEGDVEAARRYDAAQKKFVDEGRVDDAALAAEPVDAEDERQMEQAEKAGKAHAKGEDPAVSRGSGGSENR
ncbi:MAG TPA: hypothetical protein VLA16_00630 [Ideonella sp.]|nr:hypothetical protein [Ideonella sp.]